MSAQGSVKQPTLSAKQSAEDVKWLAMLVLVIHSCNANTEGEEHILAFKNKATKQNFISIAKINEEESRIPSCKNLILWENSYQNIWFLCRVPASAVAGTSTTAPWCLKWWFKGFQAISRFVALPFYGFTGKNFRAIHYESKLKSIKIHS